MLWYYKKYKKMRDWWDSRERGVVGFGGTPDVVLFILLIPFILVALLTLLFGKYFNIGKNEFAVLWLALMALVIVYLAICSFRDKG